MFAAWKKKQLSIDVVAVKKAILCQPLKEGVNSIEIEIDMEEQNKDYVVVVTIIDQLRRF